MKILHIQQFFNPQMGYQENLLPYYQQKLGHQVVVLTSTRSDGFNKASRIQPAGDFQENGFTVRRIPIQFELQHKFVWFRQLYAQIEAEQPDYIFHHSIAAPSIGVVARYKKNHQHVFVVLDNHADWTISIQNPLLKTLYYNVIWKTVLRHYDPWIDLYFGVTPGRCAFLDEELGVKADKIRFLPIGADTDHVDVTQRREDFLNRFKIDANCILFTHGGKMTPHKKINRILEAFSRLKAENIRLILFGSIEDPRVEQLMRRDSRIMFLGWLNREDTLSVLKYCDAGIWNTQHTTLLEDCVAAGLPMILRYYGSTCHLIDRSGLFLYEGSVREIQDRFNLLVEHPELLDKLRQNALILRQTLSYDTVAAESVAYSLDLDAQPTHTRLMSSEFCDFDYPNFRDLPDRGQN